MKERLMAKDYSYLLPQDLSAKLVLGRWPFSQRAWLQRAEWAEMCALYLEMDGYLDIKIKTISSDFIDTTSDLMLGRTICISLLSSINDACCLDLVRLSADLSENGILSKWLEKIEAGRKFYREAESNEYVGRLTNSAAVALSEMTEYIEMNPYKTDDTVLSILEHLCGVDLSVPMHEVMRKYDLKLDPSAEEFAAAVSRIQSDFAERQLITYGDFESTLEEVLFLAKNFVR